MWLKLLKRENVDITTISGIDKVFLNSIWKFTKTKQELFFTYFDKKVFTHYINIDLYKWGMDLYKKYFNLSSKIKKNYKKGNQLKQNITKYTVFWRKKLKRNNNQQNLLLAYNKFEKQLTVVNPIYSILSWVAIEAWQVYFDKMVTNMIMRNNLEDKQDEINNSIYYSWKPTAINKIQKKIKEGKDIKKLLNNYQFLRSWSLIWYRPITKKWINDLIKNKLSEVNYKKYSITTLNKILKTNNEERKMLKIAPYIIFFKDWRDDLRRFFCFKWHFLFEEIGKYFKIKTDDLGFFTLEEIKQMLIKNKINKKIINKRKNNPCVITTKKEILKIKILIGKENLSKYKKIIQQAEEIKDKKIKGAIGNRGMAKGRVKIVRTYHDIKRFNKGEVLVTNTTHPNYLPMMQKAIAFVTNEGGVISHAAIIARELNKPCIVGTKNATKILKDGDLVEVDANKGIVKLLTKRK